VDYKFTIQQSTCNCKEKLKEEIKVPKDAECITVYSGKGKL
jgi:hypothetical protein